MSRGAGATALPIGHPDSGTADDVRPVMQNPPGAEPVVVARKLMGGRVEIALEPLTSNAGGRPAAVARASLVLDRLERWARRVSRFVPESELSRLNGESASVVRVGPTLGALLEWARVAESMTDGLVDATLLDARLAAEGLVDAVGARRSAGSRAWRIQADARAARVSRASGLRFDVDGIAKGWLADRAVRLVEAFPVAVVDADGDIAVRLAPDRRCRVRIDDPRVPGALLAELELRPEHGAEAASGQTMFGVATSGTSVHRWRREGRATHHLIDPRTGRPAATDLVQVSVVGRSAREAEARAKAALILGSDAAAGLLDRADVAGAILLTDSGDVLATPRTAGLLVSTTLESAA